MRSSIGAFEQGAADEHGDGQPSMNEDSDWTTTIGDMPVYEAERRLNLCPDCLQNDGYHESWCQNVMVPKTNA